MLMSVIEGARSAPSFPELAGKRVLITGISDIGGVDIACAFAEHRTRLILQFAQGDESMHAVAEIAAQSALEIESFGPVGAAPDDAVQFARTAAKIFGGIDAVINLVSLAAAQPTHLASMDEIERMVEVRLSFPCVLSNIVANRMAMMLTEGVVLNVALLPAGARAGQAFASVVKAALVTITRRQAEEWAGRAIRFNAIAPQTAAAQPAAVLTGEADVAALALYLVSSRGEGLSGLVFDAHCGR
jgi:3-oxoacyl-[acyl-carrier protein] reductase